MFEKKSGKMMMLLIGLSLIFVAACGSEGGEEATSEESPYFEDFSSGQFDDVKWDVTLASFSDGAFDGDIANGALVLSSAKNYTGGNSTGSRSQIQTPKGGTAYLKVQADMKVTSISASPGAEARSMISIRYVPPANYQAGGWSDLDAWFVRAGIRDRANGGLESYLNVDGCSTSDCSTSYPTPPSTASGTLPALILNTTYTVSAYWQTGGGGDELVTSISDGTDTYIKTFDMSGTSFNPAHYYKFRVHADSREVDQPGESASITAEFDNIQADDGGGLAPYDDLDTGSLATGQWGELLGVRKIENGALLISLKTAEKSKSQQLSFKNPETIAGIRADVTVLENLVQDGGVKAHIAGYFYNDGSSSGSGDATGDVYAEIGMNSGIIFYNLVKFTAPDRSSYISLAGTPVTITNVTLNETHNLSVELQGSNMVFKVDGSNPVTLDMTALGATPSGPPVTQFKTIGVRAGSDAVNLPNTISATFDNVEVVPAP